MFFMNDGALKQLDKTEGFEVGVGPSIVVMDEGKAKSTTTTIGEGRHLRVHLQPEGFDGRARSARQQDHEDRCQVGESRPINRALRSPARGLLTTVMEN